MEGQLVISGGFRYFINDVIYYCGYDFHEKFVENKINSDPSHLLQKLDKDWIPARQCESIAYLWNNLDKIVNGSHVEISYKDGLPNYKFKLEPFEGFITWKDWEEAWLKNTMITQLPTRLFLQKCIDANVKLDKFRVLLKEQFLKKKNEIPEINVTDTLIDPPDEEEALHSVEFPLKEEPLHIVEEEFHIKKPSPNQNPAYVQQSSPSIKKNKPWWENPISDSFFYFKAIAHLCNDKNPALKRVVGYILEFLTLALLLAPLVELGKRAIHCFFKNDYKKEILVDEASFSKQYS